jgi:hypothetical protein
MGCACTVGGGGGGGVRDDVVVVRPHGGIHNNKEDQAGKWARAPGQLSTAAAEAEAREKGMEEDGARTQECTQTGTGGEEAEETTK